MTARSSISVTTSSSKPRQAQRQWQLLTTSSCGKCIRNCQRQKTDLRRSLRAAHILKCTRPICGSTKESNDLPTSTPSRWWHAGRFIRNRHFRGLHYILHSKRNIVTRSSRGLLGFKIIISLRYWWRWQVVGEVSFKSDLSGSCGSCC